MKKILYIVTLCLICSCSNFLKEYSQDLVVAKTPTDLDELMLGSGYLQSNELGVFGVGQCGAYINVMDDDVNTVINFNATKAWDELRLRLYGYTTWQYDAARNYKKDAGEDYSWNSGYVAISTANIVLEEMDKFNLTTDADQLIATRVRGEAHFLRAQIYLMLVNLYGDAYVPAKAESTLGVPLKLTGAVEFDKSTDGKFRRNTLKECYAAIVEDLKMSIRYLTESPQLRPLHRASAEAATLLLSRVYLYMQDWENAKIYAEKFYYYRKSLANMASYEGPFMDKSNPEILFSQGNLNFQKVFRGDGGDFCVSSDLLSLYDQENDLRYVKFFSKSNSTDSMSIAPKYALYSHKEHVSDVYTLRTAEGYLNLAEACAMLGDADANVYLNALREKRIIGYVPTTYTGDELIRQVREERRKELCFEGHRWFDLRRYAVCEKLPYSKELTRVFSVYDQDHSMLFLYAEIYKLRVGSPSYTLAIPSSVMEAESPYMIANAEREKNDFVEIVTVDFSEPEVPVEPEL